MSARRPLLLGSEHRHDERRRKNVSHALHFSATGRLWLKPSSTSKAMIISRDCSKPRRNLPSAYRRRHNGDLNLDVPVCSLRPAF
ncbi:hypothetical protein NL676_020853 [Syzygium grande]|nr:hypothetical protein NL676_020853 [Syzygium grande]